MNTKTETKDEELPPEAQALIDEMNKSGMNAHERISVGFWVSLARAFRKDGTLTDEQKLDLFRAGLQAYRMAAMHNFFYDTLLTKDGLERMKRNNGIPVATVVGMALLTEQQMKAATEKFLTLCEMLD